MKILVVEDSITQAISVQRILKGQGWDVTLAKNGQEGLEKANEIKPDVILSDLMMPVMDGFEFCKIIKSGPLKPIPFILLSAMGELEDKVKGLETGADDYLTKPPREMELIARIRSAHRIKEYQDELQTALDELRKIHMQMMDELEHARTTQSTILPQKMPVIPGLGIASKYVPMEQIGGDFFDVVTLPDSKVGFLVADVTGHGISAALISFMASSLFKTFCMQNSSPDLTLKNINNFLYEKIEEGKFVTVWYGIYDLEKKILTYTSAGHPPAYLIRRGTQEIIPLTAGGTCLGPFPSELNPLDPDSVKLSPGDKIVVYTDGIIECSNDQKEQFGAERLEDFLKKEAHLDVQESLDSLYSQTLEFSGKSSFGDDITLLAFEILK